ncbi:MAG: flagellar biosynthetic protein FliR [Bacillota bacterium]
MEFGYLVTFLLVLTRITAFTAVFPVFTYSGIPVLTRIGLGFILALVVTPLVGTVQPASGYGYALDISSEVLVGLAIGLTAGMVFYALRIGGQLMGITMGFAVAELLDPAGVQNNVVAEFMFLLGLIFFFSIDGHHAVLTALVKSFEVIPLTGGAAGGSTALLVARFIGGIFSTSLQLAAPVLAVMLIVDLSLGLMVRMVPQINVFMLGFPLKVTAGLLMLAGLLPALGTLLKRLFEQMVGDVFILMRGLT